MPNPSSSPDFAPQATTTQIDQMVKGDHVQTIGQVLGGMVVYVSGGQAIINAAPETESILEKPKLGQNPYKGLLAFQEMDGDLFFGRSTQIQQLWQKFRDLPEAKSGVRLLPIYGPSGSGKSSLARAGLIPELARRPVPGKHKAKVAVLVPGTRPIAALATVLARIAMNDPSPTEKIEAFEKELLRVNAQEQEEAQYDGLRRIADALPGIEDSPLILLVDQLEEIYTLCKDAEHRTAFVQNLLCAASDHANRVSVIVTMRSDFLGETQKYPVLNRLFSTQGFLAPVMNKTELRKAISEPAELAGHSLDDKTIDRLIYQTEDREGALPLLQFALKQIWKGIEKGIPPAVTLENLGGVGGALAETAERVYTALQPEQEGIAQRVFLGLVELGEGTRRDTRRRVAVERLISSNDELAIVRQVLEKFTNPVNRLITCSATEDGTETAEVTHEALFDHWERLQDWLSQSRSELRFQRRLEVAAAEWDKMNRPEGKLWRSPDLDLLREYYKQASNDIFSLGECAKKETIEKAFFAASVNAVKKAEKEKKRQQRRLVGALSAGLAFTTVAAAFATFQIQQVERQRVDQLAATSETLRLSGQPFNAKIHAIAAIGASKSKFVQFLRSSPFHKAHKSLLNSIQTDSERNQLKGHQNSVTSIAFSPDSKIMVSGGSDNTLRLWDVAAEKPIGEPLVGHESPVEFVAFSPDGKTIISGSDANHGSMLRRWDVATGKPIGEPLSAPYVRTAAFSPDGKTIVSGSGNLARDHRESETLRLWDVKTGEPIGKPWIGHEYSSVKSVAFSPDGKTIVSGSEDRTLRLWDTAKRQPIGAPLRGHESPVEFVAFSPDGKTIISGSSEGTLRLWDTAKRQPIGAPLRGPKSPVESVAFSPDGKTIISGSSGGTLQLWDLDTREPIGEALKSYEADVTSLAFSLDSKTIVRGSRDGTLRLWDITKGNLASKSLSISHVRPKAVSPDGKTIVGDNNIKDRTLRLWNTETKEPVGNPLNGHEYYYSPVAFSPDSKMIFIGSGEFLQLWNVDTGTLIGEMVSDDEFLVKSAAFSADGKTIVGRSFEGSLQIWDVATREPIGNLLRKDQFSSYPYVVLSPDRKIIFTGGNNSLQLWNTKTGESIGEPLEGQSLAFSPDGKTIAIASGSYDGTLRLWDLTTRKFVGESLSSHESSIRSIAFSPDGKTIVSGSEAGRLRLWDTVTKELIGELISENKSSIVFVSFSPDRGGIVSWSNEGELRMWTVSKELLLQNACNQLRSHPTLKTPESDVEKEAKRTCDRYVWSKEKTSS